MFCKHCGKEIDAQAAFCSHCGGKIQSAEELEAIERQKAHDEWRAQMAAKMGHSKPAAVQPSAQSAARPQTNSSPKVEPRTYASAVVETPVKEKKKHPILGTILVILGVLITVGALFGGNDEPQRVDKAPSSQSETTEPSVDRPFTVGDTVELDDVYVTLEAIYESGGSTYFTPADGNTFIVCEFTIENNTKEDLTVSSMMCFDAYVDDFTTNMSLSATTTADKPQLDGTVAPGKKMNGVIGYEVPADWSTFEIRFTPNLWSKEFVFVYDNPTSPGVSSASGTQIGSILLDNDVVSVAYVGAHNESSLGVFYVTLNVENRTDSDIVVALEDADVDGEAIPLITTGAPLIIRPDNSGQTGFIFSMADLSISSMDEAGNATFRVVVRDNDTYDVLFESDLITVDLH